MLTADDLQQLLFYDPATGDFLWREKPSLTSTDLRWNGRYAGTKAGGKLICKNVVYWRITIANKNYLAHRLAVLYVTGEWPPNLVRPLG